MPTRFTVVLDDDQARAVRTLASRYGLSEEAVLRQLVESGLDQTADTAP